MAERAGYTVTMFVVDVSPSMGKVREVYLPMPNGDTQAIEMTNLEWSLQFVKLKIQEMIYNGRKTDQCGVILFGTEDTNNVVNAENGGYEHVFEYIPIGQPNAGTLAKLSELQPATEIGDPIDALIVAVETQDNYLAKKKTWTRKMVLLTDGENPIEVEDWEATAKKMNALGLRLTVIGVDFDDEDYPFVEEDKSDIKRANEEFYHEFTEKLDIGVVGNCAYALEEISRPEVKETKSALSGTVLRLGDVEDRPDQAIEILVKSSKCTALARPKSWKKFGRHKDDNEDIIMQDAAEIPTVTYTQLSMRTEYVIDKPVDEDDDDGVKIEEDEPEIVEKESLIRGYKYGTSYAPCPDGSFPRLETKKGIDFCGFFNAKNFRRELAMGEVQYIWADPSSPLQQVALSSIVQAMADAKGPRMAIARWVSKDGMDPKMGVLAPTLFDGVDCFLWVQMPFADDVRRYTFPSLDRLINKKGQVVTNHPYLPTTEQIAAMENFVDGMDLMHAGDEDEEGIRGPWYDTRYSYNPAIHRTKQAQFHAAVVTDLRRQPLPPPHPELLKYLKPPKKVVKRANQVIADVKEKFNVREVPKKHVNGRKDGHVRARDEGDALLLENVPRKKPKLMSPSEEAASRSQIYNQSAGFSQRKIKGNDSDSETESESEPEEDLLLGGMDEEKKVDEKIEPMEEDKKVDEKVKPMEEDVKVPPTPQRPMSPKSESESGRELGRIVNLQKPLEDFHKNLAAGDLVSKVVEDMAYVIKEVVNSELASERTEEMIACMQAMRETALTEDEVGAWNDFLQDLKITCLEEEPGNVPFWVRVTDFGRAISLISQPELGTAGGKSKISEARAKAFIRRPHID